MKPVNIAKKHDGLHDTMYRKEKKILEHYEKNCQKQRERCTG